MNLIINNFLAKHDFLDWDQFWQTCSRPWERLYIESVTPYISQSSKVL